MSDWMFDEADVARELEALAAEVEEALLHARGALEGCDADAPIDAERETLQAAAEAVRAARRRLGELDAETLADAEAMLREVLARSDRFAAEPLPDLPMVAHGG